MQSRRCVNHTKHYKFSSNHPSGIGQPFIIISHCNISMSHVSINTMASGVNFLFFSLGLGTDANTATLRVRFIWDSIISIVAGFR